MAQASPKSAANEAESHKSTTSLKETLSKRLSKELVIALCGPLGCGIKQVKRMLEEQLGAAGYNVVDIRISSLMQAAIADHAKLSHLKSKLPKDPSDNYDRISSLQTLGNDLRHLSGNDIGAQLAIREIAVWRVKHKDAAADELAITTNTVFIIDQLKHPDEVKLLETLYSNIYYQVGILSTEDEKLQRLKGIGIDKACAVELIETDRKEELKHGQQLEKTLQLSDYFLANTEKNLPSLNRNINRFLSLVHGINGITPTKDEVGMYSAYSSSLRSACLSRQVGAAICDEEGNILAIGRNDVPKSKGGLYTPEDGDLDHRCINHGAKCHNTERINMLKLDIQKILINQGEIDADLARTLIDSIEENTPLGSIIEYSRAIHAEMDAIISLARNLKSSTKGSIIYTTTFPCHNCARHIVAAGIAKVVYIEPYAKSLAIDLHSDSICLDGNSDNKVRVESFEGVAPTKYQKFFVAKGKRKDNKGNAIITSINNTDHIDPILVAKYTDTEKMVSTRLTKSLDEESFIDIISVKEKSDE